MTGQTPEVDVVAEPTPARLWWKRALAGLAFLIPPALVVVLLGGAGLLVLMSRTSWLALSPAFRMVELFSLPYVLSAVLAADVLRHRPLGDRLGAAVAGTLPIALVIIPPLVLLDLWP